MRKEPPFEHGTPLGTAVLLVNLGTPDQPDTPSVRRYLREFLSDRRVVEIPRLLWWLILHGIILRLRPKKSAAKYASIWTDEGSPLLAIGRKQAEALQKALNNQKVSAHVRLAMRYGNPSVASVLDELRAQAFDRVLVLPLYPQYAAATTATVGDAVMNWSLNVRNVPEFRFIKHYHDHSAYIQALVERIQAQWGQLGRPRFEAGELLLMSFHGVPQQTLLQGDPYHCECQKTARLVAESLGLEKDHYRVTFQSRLGKAKWLQPYTDSTLKQLGQAGVSRVDVVCPGFMADCLETLEEINMEGRETFLHAGGGQFNYLPCLNDSAQTADLLAELVRTHTQGWPVLDVNHEAQVLHLKASRELADTMRQQTS